MSSKASSARPSASPTLTASRASLPARWRSTGSAARRLHPIVTWKPASASSSSRASPSAARARRSSSSAGTITAISAVDSPPSGAASEPGANERSVRIARFSTRSRHSPVWATRGAVRTTITPAPFARSAPSSAARATMSPRSVTWRPSTASTKALATSSLSHSGDRERSSSSASRVVTIRAIVGSGSVLPRWRSSPTTLSATRSSVVVTPSPAASSFCSWSGEAPATASTAPERSIRATLASSTRAAARATAGRPAPASTASESAARSPASAGFAAFFWPFAVADMAGIIAGRARPREPRAQLKNSEIAS